MSRHGDYEAVRKDIAAQLQKPGYDDGSAGPVFVRLAWYVTAVEGEVVSVAEGLPDGRDAGSRRKQDLLTLSLCSSQALRRYL